MKTRKICTHLHILFSVLGLSSTPADTPSSSGTIVASPETISSRTQEPLSISRVSSIKLNLMRPLIPYPVPVEMLLACREYSKSSRPSCFVPPFIDCGLCGSPLTEGRRHPGQGPEDVSYLLTPSIFCHVNVQVKICTNKECKAMHQVWPIDQGLFNICDKMIVAVEILVQWRNLFRQGVPLTISIESSLSVWVKCAQLQFNDSELKYITGMLYNGFYAFEILSDRSLDNVVCGICGVVGQIYYGDGNEKNCCSTHSVDYSKASQVPNDGPPLSLENFLEKMKGIFVEKITYTTSNQDGKVVASNVPPIIAPSLRAQTVFNTEMEKKSVYLEGKYFEKDAINGDPMMLHYIIKNKPLDMTSLESLPIEELRAICRECKINNVARLSKALLLHTLQLLYSSILTGASPCHGFTQVANNTGGFYHMVCRHGATVASKFLLLQESVRDAADLYLSLKYPPVLLVNDTPCGFARHLDIREPSLTKHLWGDCLGCFQKPDPDMEPKEVSIPQIVPSEFSSINLSTEALSIDSTRHLQHPLTGSVRRYVVGDRFHTSTNPHKSKLCAYHDIRLCHQRDTIKTSYQECQNNSKNVKCLCSSTMQSFPVHFVYNFLMDFYHNECIVERQRKELSSSLKDGQALQRDNFLRFTVINSK